MFAKTLLPLSLAAVFFSLDTQAWKPQDTAPAAKEERSTKELVIDAVHSSVVFCCKHMKAANFYGRFNQIAGSFKVDDADLGDSFVKIQIPAESIDTNSEGRDRHLKSQDFFNVKEYPKVTFESTKVEKKGDRYLVTGDLEIRGVKKSITAEAEHTGTATLSPRFGLRSGYEARFSFKRSDFGMTYMTGGGLGDEVKVILSVEGKLP